MEQKTKFIIIGLAGALAVVVFLFFQALSGKQVLMREKDDLQKENVSLSAKLDKLSGELRLRQEEFSGLKKEIDRLGRERDDLQRRYLMANQEREDALTKLKEFSEAPKKMASSVPGLPAGQESYWAEVLKAKTELEMQLGSLRTELKSMQLANEQAEREKNNLELDLAGVKHDNDELKRQIDYNQKLMDSLAQEMVRERNDKIKIEEALKEIRGENTGLTRQLKSLNSRKVGLDGKIQELQDEKASLSRKSSEMETVLTEKLTQIDSLKKKLEVLSVSDGRKQDGQDAVQLPPIVVRPAAQAKEAAGLAAGRILSINKENNFVIIDIGEDAAVKTGHALGVYRGDKRIADLEVIQTRKDISACDIKKALEPVAVGDIVK